MPYISQHARSLLKAGRQPETLGELNYVITSLCLDWLSEFRVTGQVLEGGYGTYAAIVGMLETVKLELYRRAVVPYEEAKIQENGDVYLDNEASDDFGSDDYNASENGDESSATYHG